MRKTWRYAPFTAKTGVRFPLRAKEISSVTTSTPKFQQDLATRLSEIAQDGATPALVTALMVAVRRVVEDTKTQETFKLTCLFYTWSMHLTMNRNDAIPKLLDGFNNIIVACLQGNFTGMSGSGNI
jgi:hypothetical protein